MTRLRSWSQLANTHDALSSRTCSNTPWSASGSVVPSNRRSVSHGAHETLEMVKIHYGHDAQRVHTAALNDQARAAMGTACTVETTAAFRRLPVADQTQIKAVVARFDLWTIAESHDANRDFGVIFKHSGAHWSQETPQAGDPIEAVFWKIDCFDHAHTQISEQPWDETLTARVLTLMLAHEY